MKRIAILFATLAIAALPVLTFPAQGYAATSCIDQFYRCYNDASAYSGAVREIAEAECSIEYVGCLASKLKFW